MRRVARTEKIRTRPDVFGARCLEVPILPAGPAFPCASRSWKVLGPGEGLQRPHTAQKPSS
eukprot:2527220-Pyramimonas_sp.AAC.1